MIVMLNTTYAHNAKSLSKIEYPQKYLKKMSLTLEIYLFRSV